MALTIRKDPASLAFGVATAFNAFMRKFVESETSFPHYDITSTPSGSFDAPVSTALGVVNSSTADLSAVILMAEEMRSVMLKHFADALAHKAADTTDAALLALGTVPTATDQTSVNLLLNALATAYAAHRVSTSYHLGVDATNVVTALSATDLASSKTLAADIRTQIIAHILFGWTTPSLNLVQD